MVLIKIEMTLSAFGTTSSGTFPEVVALMCVRAFKRTARYIAVPDHRE